MRTREEIEVEMAKLRAEALAAVKPHDERSSALHAWLALAWALGPDVQRAAFDELFARITDVDRGAG